MTKMEIPQILPEPWQTITGWGLAIIITICPALYYAIRTWGLIEAIRNRAAEKRARQGHGKKVEITEARSPRHTVFPKVAGYAGEENPQTEVKKNAFSTRTVNGPNGKRKTMVHQDENQRKFLLLKTGFLQTRRITITQEDADRITDAEQP